MSQAKVDAYKEEKKNRKKNVQKEKRKKLLWKIFGPILAILVLAAIGATAYFIPKLTKEAQEAESQSQYDDLIKTLQDSGIDVSANDVTVLGDDAVPVEPSDN